MRCLLGLSAAVLLSLGASAQAQTRYYDPAPLVQSWYQTYLGRSADAPGLDAWLQQVRQGASLGMVQAGILASDEYYARHAYTPESFVQGLYADVLRRTASPEEVYVWVDRLAVDGGNRQQLAIDFLATAGAELGQGGLAIQTPYRPARVYYGPGFVRPYGYYGYPARRWSRSRLVIP
jgi:hypothetical protein